uniref:Uncharacterized protein n=1 Tax=Mesocestoides corti TaxID=53468 RepID=A0A5K3G5W2_MESCO
MVSVEVVVRSCDDGADVLVVGRVLIGLTVESLGIMAVCEAENGLLVGNGALVEMIILDVDVPPADGIF